MRNSGLHTFVTKPLSVRFLMLEGEKQLIQDAQNGNTASFGELYDHYISPIYRFIYLKVSEKRETEDLTHEVFLTAWKNLKRYKYKGFPFSSWLYQIARNKVIDHYRLKRHHTPIESVADSLPEDVEHADFALDRTFQLEEVKVALQKLSSDQQDVIIMKFIEDMSHQEIARAIDKSEGATRLIQHRAIKSLKRALKPLEQETHEA